MATSAKGCGATWANLRGNGQWAPRPLMGEPSIIKCIARRTPSIKWKLLISRLFINQNTQHTVKAPKNYKQDAIETLLQRCCEYHALAVESQAARPEPPAQMVNLEDCPFEHAAELEALRAAIVPPGPERTFDARALSRLRRGLLSSGIQLAPSSDFALLIGGDTDTGPAWMVSYQYRWEFWVIPLSLHGMTVKIELPLKVRPLLHVLGLQHRAVASVGGLCTTALIVYWGQQSMHAASIRDSVVVDLSDAAHGQQRHGCGRGGRRGARGQSGSRGQQAAEEHQGRACWVWAQATRCPVMLPLGAVWSVASLAGWLVLSERLAYTSMAPGFVAS